MTQTFDPTWDTATESVKAGILIVLANTNSLIAANKGPTPPPYAVEGTFWLDDSGTENVLKVFADLLGTGPDWYEVGRVHSERIEMIGPSRADREILNLALQKLGAHPLYAPEDEGRVYHFDHRPFFVRENPNAPGTYQRTTVSVWSADEFLPVDLPAGSWIEHGGATRGATHGAAAGILFDALGEKITTEVRIPVGTEPGIDGALRFRTAITQAEVAGDDEDWTLTAFSVTPDQDESVVGPSTVVAPYTKDLGTNVSDGAVAEHEIPITSALLAGGTRLHLTLERTDLAEVGATLFLGAELLFPAGARATE